MATEIDIKINTANAAKSVGEIRKQIKELDSAALNVGEGGKGFDQLTKKSAELRDKLEDLKDTTQSLKGSGVERLTQSFGLLKEGFANADTGKIATGFKALGTAMKAIPIFLLIEGIRLLAENFDKVVGFLNGSTAALKEAQVQYDKTTLAASTLSAALQREIDLLTAQGASEEKILKVKKEKLAQDLLAAEATYRLNSAKILDINANDSLYESYLRVSGAIAGFFGDSQKAEQNEKLIAINKAERAAEFVKGQHEAEEAIKDIVSKSQVIQAEAVTKKNNAIKKSNDDLLKQELANYEKRAAAENAAIDKSEAAAKGLNEKKKALLDEEELRLASSEEEKLAIIAARQIKELELQFEHSKILGHATVQAENDLAIAKAAIQSKYLDDVNTLHITQNEAEKKASEERLKIAEKETEDKKKLKQQEFDTAISTAQTLSSATQKIVDLGFQQQLKGAQGNQKKELEIRKKQFKVNKAYGIVNATIDGIQGVAKALNNPYPLNLVLAAASAVAAAANVAAIASTEFTGTESGGSSSGDTASGGGISGTVVQGPGTNTAGTTFNQDVVGQVNGQGGATGGGIQLPTQRVVVLESDITNTQDTIATIEQSNSF